MSAVKPLLGLILVAVAAWPAKIAVRLFSILQPSGPPPGPGVIIHHTVVLYGHSLSGWRARAAMILFAVAAAGMFIAGLRLAFSVLRETK